MPKRATRMVYADDLALVIEGMTEAEISQRTTTAIRGVVNWLRTRGFSVAPDKTEAVALVGRRKICQVSFQVLGRNVKSQESISYLGIKMGRNLRVAAQVHFVQCKSAKITNVLNRIMFHVGGPRSSKRRLLVSAVLSVALYAVSAWGSEV